MKHIKQINAPRSINNKGLKALLNYKRKTG